MFHVKHLFVSVDNSEKILKSKIFSLIFYSKKLRPHNEQNNSVLRMLCKFNIVTNIVYGSKSCKIFVYFVAIHIINRYNVSNFRKY